MTFEINRKWASETEQSISLRKKQFCDHLQLKVLIIRFHLHRRHLYNKIDKWTGAITAQHSAVQSFEWLEVTEHERVPLHKIEL